MKSIPLLMLICLTSACTQLLVPEVNRDLFALREGQYRIDPNHSRLLFKINHLGLSEFVGRFNAFDASLDFDPQNLDGAKLEAAVEMGSIDVNNSQFEKTLKGRFWLNSGRFPKAYFKTDKVSLIDSNSADFSGNLIFLGVTQPISLRIDFNGGAFNPLTGKYTIGFKASGSFNRSDFGLDDYIPAVGNEVNLEIHAEFQRQLQP